MLMAFAPTRACSNAMWNAAFKRPAVAKKILEAAAHKKFAIHERWAQELETIEPSSELYQFFQKTFHIEHILQKHFTKIGDGQYHHNGDHLLLKKAHPTDPCTGLFTFSTHTSHVICFGSQFTSASHEYTPELMQWAFLHEIDHVTHYDHPTSLLLSALKKHNHVVDTLRTLPRSMPITKDTLIALTTMHYQDFHETIEPDDQALENRADLWAIKAMESLDDVKKLATLFATYCLVHKERPRPYLPYCELHDACMKEIRARECTMSISRISRSAL